MAGDSASEFTYETRRSKKKKTIECPNRKYYTYIYIHIITQSYRGRRPEDVYIYEFLYIIDDLLLYHRSYLYVINLRVREGVMFLYNRLYSF